MKNKQSERLLYSAVGVGAVFLILVAFNFLAGRVKQRVDLTADKAYTLSEGTRAILKKLDTPVTIRFYSTQGENEMPVFLKTYARRVEDLLSEYKQAGRGNIEIERLDPQPDSDAEDSANLDGVEGQMLSNGEKVYLGLAVSQLDAKAPIPFLSPDREKLLEYDISRAIARVTTSDKPVVGIMSGLSVFGQPMNPMMMQMGQRGQEPWALVTELKRDFTVKDVPATSDSIPEDVKVLLVIHPRGFTETAQYAIDQFVLRGGKLVAFLDPLCVLDQRGGGNPMMGSPPSTSSLEKLLGSWGLQFDTTKVVADMTYSGRTRQGLAPAVLGLTQEAANADDVVTSQADNLLMAFSGAFSGTPTPGLTQTVLLKSSKESQLVEGMMAQMGGDQIARDFSPSGTEYPLAVRLTGKFKTAFPAGKPAAKDPATPDGKPGENPPTPEANTAAGLKESAQDGVVVLIGDADMIHDQIAIQEVPNPFGQRIAMPANGNLALAQGSVEQLAGDANLIAVRSRASTQRPFTVVREMQARAEASYRNKIREMEESLADTQRKLNELQKSKQGGQQKFILSPEQQKELENFRRTEIQVKKDLKQERKRLRQDIDSLENRTKWLNIAGMPLLVAVSGVGLALWKRKRTAAR